MLLRIVPRGHESVVANRGIDQDASKDQRQAGRSQAHSDGSRVPGCGERPGEPRSLAPAGEQKRLCASRRVALSRRNLVSRALHNKAVLAGPTCTREILMVTRAALLQRRINRTRGVPSRDYSYSKKSSKKRGLAQCLVRIQAQGGYEWR